jgi:uncharacterized protein
MRAPDELPRRQRRKPGGRRGRIVLIIAVIAAFFLLTSLRGIAGFYTDYLWFDALDQTGVWRGVLGARVVLVVIFVAAFFTMTFVNLVIADRLAPPFRVAGPEDELLERYHDLVAGRMLWIRVAIAGVLGLIAGSGASAEWNSWILFTNGGDFGITDEQFGLDVGFYVFQLPFLSFLVDWLFAALLIIVIITTVAHYMNGGIRVQPPTPRVTPQVKAHLSVLLAVLALVKTADYWLQRYELTTSSRGVVDGATYTDVNAQLPAINLLVLISVAAALLFVANIFRRGWTLPAVAVGLWMFVAIVVGGIYPQYVQRFQVSPNELARERPYIERNITATQQALGLEGVETRRFVPKDDAEDVSLAGAGPTIRNIRLWDPAASVSGRTFEQLQQIRGYYSISDVDVDRYEIDGERTQVNIGARTINPDRIPNPSWEAQHLAYTHGYGVVVAPSNAARGNEPGFVVQNIPPRVGVPELELDEPGIYFGEDLGGYVITNTSRNEIDFQEGEETRFTEYDGDDGVGIGSPLRRVAFALRFGDINPLISNYLNGDSRVVFIRDVVDRVTTLAPFLHADDDPYPVVLDGRVVYVIDMYTTTNRYPYAQRADSDQVSTTSGLDHGFNYVRNSVKATVDAYDGTVALYVVEDDPILEAYRQAFPDLFTDGDEMSDDLRAHLRYPEDLFRVQTAAYARYHLTEPDDFFNRDRGWRVARDPGTAGADPTTPVTDASGQPTGVQTAARIAPYYQLLQMPDENEVPDEAEMVLMRSFVPFSEDDQRQQLTAFMAARMEPDSYGELIVYEMPSEQLPAGPGIAAATINANEAVSTLENLLGRGGSEVRFGNLLLVPVDNALLYVQPFYVVSEQRDLPLLEKVIAVFDESVVIEDTLSEALSALFGDRAETLEEPPVAGTDVDEDDEVESDAGEPDEGEVDEVPDAPITGTAAERAAQLLAEAEELFAEADEALSDRQLGLYEERLAEARERVDEAIALLTDDEPPDGGDDAEETTPA